MLEKKSFIKELGADVYTYNTNGLYVIFVDKECDEFAFNATVNNKHICNNGLPHMVEHCVFGGSSNYNIDEPFEYLVKTKKYTYLNAITYRDRTVFPFSTYSINDFDEIFDVYLDAIFNAKMSKETFEQECIRLDKGEYNGIILNEMMEMYADDFYKNECEILSELDDVIFKFNSAGEPDAIKTVKYEDVIKYYTDNYITSNIVICFYGKFEHAKYIDIISKKINNRDKTQSTDKTNINKTNVSETSEFIDIKDIHLESETAIVITYKFNEIVYEREFELFLQCIILTKQDEIFNILRESYKIKSLSASLNTDLNIKYLVVRIKHDCTSDEHVTCENFIEVLEQILQQYNYEEFNEELYKKCFLYRNKDHGYKTQGVYTLLEISKIGKGVYSYNKAVNENLTRLPFKYKANANNIHLVRVLEEFERKFIQHNNEKNIDTNPYLEHTKKSEKNINNLFFSSTNYDIINTIIYINLKDIFLTNTNVLDYFNINENVFKQLNFIKDIYTSRVKSNKIALDGFYINILVYTSNMENMLSVLNQFLANLKLNVLLEVTNSKSINSNFKVQDIINYITNNALSTETQLGKTVCISEMNTDIHVEFEVFKMDENTGNIVQISKVLNERFLDNINHLLQLINLQSNKPIKVQKEQKNNEVSQNELYKNFLVIDIEQFTNDNNKYVCDIDYMYIELLLEYLVNEKLLEQIRFKNGAYEVNFKLLKLENKVVLYSNIDRNSKTTLDIFKMELESLNMSYLSDIEKYLNKITNNFYRNEQNKNIKTKKQFDNWLLNIQDTLTSFDYNKVEQAIYILKNSEIVGEFSFGKTSYKNFKNGGTYVY